MSNERKILNYEVAADNNGKPKYPCEICDMEFKKKSDIEKHEK